MDPNANILKEADKNFKKGKEAYYPSNYQLDYRAFPMEKGL